MSHRRRLALLALPVYVELLAGVAAGAVDLVWAARLGPSAIAAVTAGTTVENLLLGVILTAELGLTVVAARRRGAADHAGVRTAVRSAWRLYALITPVVAIGGLLARHHIAALLAPAGDARTLAAAFFAVSLPAVAVMYAQQIVNGAFKALGDTRTPMRLALLSTAVLIVLDPLLILGPPGSPGLGVTGAALATAAARATALATGLVLLRRRLRPYPPAAPGRAREAFGIAAAGVAPAADFTVRMAGSVAILAVVAGFGPAVTAAYGIGLKAMYAATMAFYALRQAATIHVAHRGGAGVDDARAVTRDVLALAVSLGLAAAVVYGSCGAWIMRVFTGDAAVIAAGAAYLRWMAVYLPALACLVAIGGVAIGAGRGRVLPAVTAAGALGQVPVAWLFGAFAGIDGVWAVVAVAAGAQFAAVSVWTRRARPRDDGPAMRTERRPAARAAGRRDGRSSVRRRRPRATGRTRR